MSTQFTMITGNGTRLTRPLRLLGSIVRHPLRFAKVLWPFGWGRRTVIFLVMQTLDNAIAFRCQARLVRWHRPAHRTESGEAQPDLHPGRPTRPPNGWLHTPAVSPRAWCSKPRRTFRRRRTLLGGAVIGKDAGSGVVDRLQPGLRLPQPAGLRRCGDAGEPGVNPSLTITAITEHAMSHIPPAQPPR